MEEKYISDVIDLSKMDKRSFNLVYSFCGTGKTYFVGNHLVSYLQDVKPQEIIFVTSRSMVVEQQAKINDQNICKFDPHDTEIIRGWNGEIDLPDTLAAYGIQIMTIDKLIFMILDCASTGYETLKKAKVIIIDECHTLFSDMFIRDMKVLHVWLRDRVEFSDKILIGLTATPNILLDASKRWGVNINILNEEPLIRYKVKNLYCSEYEELEYICNDNRFAGKSIVMCYSVSDCYELQKLFKNSAVLISASNKEYDKLQMDYIRNFIIENETLPDTYINNGEVMPLDTLITTSTMREGINLQEKSCIRNVICCIPDELHVTQFVGRCRFNIENLIVVNTSIYREKYQNGYLYDKRAEFRAFMKNPNDHRWFDTVKILISDPNRQPEILKCKHNHLESCIDEKFLGCKVYLEKDKNLIVEQAKRDKIFDIPMRDYTFNRVMRYLEDTGKYNIETVRIFKKDISYSAKILIKNNS